MAQRKNRNKSIAKNSGQASPEERNGLSRREFLAGLAATPGALGVGGGGEGESVGTRTGGTAPSEPESAPLPNPQDSGIEHVVVLMMENRSFDHFLGWLPGADGKQAGLMFPDKQGQMHPTFPLAPNFQNCQFDDPDHGYDGGRVQWDD